MNKILNEQIYNLNKLLYLDNKYIGLFECHKYENPMCTYILKDGSGFCKIGRTVTIRSRFEALRIGNPNLHIVLLINGDLELYLHKKFEENHYALEWYYLSENDLEQIKLYCCENDYYYIENTNIANLPIPREELYALSALIGARRSETDYDNISVDEILSNETNKSLRTSFKNICNDLFVYTIGDLIRNKDKFKIYTSTRYMLRDVVLTSLKEKYGIVLFEYRKRK